MLSHAGAILLALGLCGILPACASSSRGRSEADHGATAGERARTAESTPRERPRLSLRLYYGIGLIGQYDYASILPRIRALRAEDAMATITEHDVESYRTDREPSNRVEFVLSPAASERVLGSASGGDGCGEGPFVLYLDEHLLYGGQCYSPHGAAGLQYPVLHAFVRDGRWVLEIVASQSGVVDSGPSSRIIDPMGLRSLFEGLGRLERLR